MKPITTRTMELRGSSYEIGRSLGRYVSSVPALKNWLTAGYQNFGLQEVKEALKLFERWCPGLPEELAGFADELKAAPESVVYYAMTYLRPSCSHAALPPVKTAVGRPLLARNYEFHDDAEDFTLIKTCPDGKYTHLGTSVLCFGRDDGLNEHGLAVTMSSCGFPVGPNQGMRKPALKGLQFWAVIRTLLERCKNTEEAVSCLQDMPIAYNMNLILLDRLGHGALAETLDGRLEVRCLDSEGESPYLHATNHPVLESMISLEPQAMNHSLVRYERIKEILDQPGLVTVDELKNMLLSPYPHGLCCHYYNDFFGTTKSMIIDPEDGTIDLCWGGRKENGWQTYRLTDTLPRIDKQIAIELQTADPELFRFVSIKR